MNNRQLQTLETERLILRAFRRGDLPDFHKYAVNPNVGPRAGWAPHTSLAESWRVLAELRRSCTWAIEEKATGCVIGSIDLREDRMRPTVGSLSMGYSLAEETWGRGYATEAARAVVRHVFVDLGQDALAADHYPENLASKRVLQKCGFRYEGTLRRAGRLFNGIVYDRVCYFLTRQEYFSQQETETRKGEC